MEKADENIEDAKRIKQLENQNLKLKRLLQTAVDISNQDLIRNDSLRNENNDLSLTVNDLEEEKHRLEKQLTEILEKNESGLVRALRKLEEEHTELQAEMQNVLTSINEEQTEITKLESEDIELRSALIKLEQEKCKLLDRLKKVEEKKNNKQDTLNKQKRDCTKELASTSLNPELSTSKKTKCSNEDILSDFIQLEQTYREYIDILEEHTLQNKISELISKNEKLASGLDRSKSDTKLSQIKLNETILYSNTNILNKIKDVKSKLVTSIEKNITLNSGESKTLSMRISVMEKERDMIYEELEEYLQNSSRDICKLAENVNDQDAKLLIHEIEVQKAVLLYNLRMLKLKETNVSKKIDDHSKETLAPPSSPASLGQKDSNEIEQLFTNDTEASGKSLSMGSSDTEAHQRLEETVTRLENERKQLLKQLQTVSGTPSLRYEERQLQTQSELHSSFMRETSSQEINVNENLDDATNHLYRAEDIRLEQRIRELEIENNRIKREVQRIVESAQCHHLPAQVLRERIEELEKKTQSQPQIE